MRATVTLLVLSLTALAGAEDGVPPVVTAPLEWEPGTVGGARSQTMELTDAPPDGTPALEKAEGVRYGSVRLGPLRPFVVATRTDGDTTFIRVDTDMDGDLADERERPWELSGTILRHETTVLVPVPGDAVPFPVEVWLTRSTSSATNPVTVSPRAYRVGEAILAGRLRRIALVDENGDLCFDDAQHDVFYVDVDGDGEFAAGHGTAEHFHFGAPVRIGDRGFEVSAADAAGSALSFRQTEPPPASELTWKGTRYAGPGRAQTPPAETFEELEARFDEERGGTYSERYQTISALGRTGDADAPALLLRIADDDSDTSVRSAAVRALGNPAYVDAVGSKVAKLTKGGDANLASAAIQALYDMGHPDREKLFVGLVGTSNTSVAGAAARYLAYEATETGVAALLRASREASTPALLYQIYNAARSLPTGPPPELMLRMAREDYPSGQGRALEDLALIGHPEAAAIARELAEVRPVVRTVGLAVARVLGARNDADAVAACLEVGAAGDEEVRREVVRRLASLRDTTGVNVLVKALRSKEEPVRTLAAQVVAGIPEDRVTDALLARATKERDEPTLAAVLDALGDHKDPRAADVLIKAAKQKRYAIVRMSAMRALGLLGMDLPEIRDFFLKLLGAKDWEDRIYAIDAAGAAGDSAVVGKLLPNIEHDRRQVRLATAQALARLRSGEAVQPLIDRLEREEVQRVRAAIAHALFVTTGTNLYDDHGLWTQWITDNGGNFRVPDAIPSLPAAETGGTSASFYGIPVDSDRVGFVIDQSGSMSAQDSSGVGSTTDDAEAQPNRLDVAVREVLRMLGQLPDGAHANVIFFHTTIHPWNDELARLTRKTRGELTKHMLEQKPTGGTNLYDGLETALLDREIDTVLLLSDGVPGSGKYVATEDILRAVRRLNQTRRIVIHTVSLGRESDLMRRLAEENAGTYVRR